MPAPSNKGGRVPPVVAPPAAAPEELSLAVVAAPAAREGSVDLSSAKETLATLGKLASPPSPAAFTIDPNKVDPARLADAMKSGEHAKLFVDGREVPLPPAPRGFVAVFPIVVGPHVRVEPGEVYRPTDDAERDLFLAQGVIRPA